VALILTRDGGVGTLLPAGLLGILLLPGFAAGTASRYAYGTAGAGTKAGEVRELQQLNQLIVQRMRTGILFVDAHDRVRIANDAASRLLGIGRHELADGGVALRLPRVVTDLLDLWRANPRHAGAPLRLRRTARWCGWHSPGSRAPAATAR
jgi:two-component system sensor histidine kinase PilS (NtrC family)